MESLINQLEIVTLLYNGNTKGAIKAFEEKNKAIENKSILLLRISLNALNQCIYDYILLKENISLHACCLQNYHSIIHCTASNYLSIGTDIINSYGNCSDYLIEKHQNEHIRKTIAYVHKNLSETLTLNDICNEININKCYLCNLFKQEVKMSFCDYVTRQRIVLAKELLKSKDLRIQDIAYRCGFKSTAYFCTCFRKIVGISPSEYR